MINDLVTFDKKKGALTHLISSGFPTDFNKLLKELDEMKNLMLI